MGGKQGKSEAVVVDRCKAMECKKESNRMEFCAEHYDWFKFGLINKKGEKVSDFEKKFEHYLAYQTKSARKVA